MNINNFDKIEIDFEETSIILPSFVIEKFQAEKVEQLIEKKYEPEDIYNIYIVFKRQLLEKIWEDELSKKVFINLKNKPIYKDVVECLKCEHIYSIHIYKKDKKLKTYNIAWSLTEFNNENQKIGVTDDKILIRIIDL